jgi:hypothetical protein
MQSASAPQVVLQAVAPHAYGAQAIVGGVMQVPEPSHLPTKLEVPPEQIAAAQLVLPVGAEHAAGLLPSHEVGPQFASTPLGRHALRALRGVPLIVVHVPTLPGSAHA